MAKLCATFLMILACSLLQVNAAKPSKGKNFHAQSNPELRELVEINGKNYYFFMQDSVSWYRAADMCAGKNMTLTSIESQQEDDAINRFLVLNPAYDQFLWTSGARLDGSTWRWEASGEALGYTNWGSGQPSIAEGSPACLNILARPQRYWDDDDCNIALHPFCEEPNIV